MKIVYDDTNCRKSFFRMRLLYVYFKVLETAKVPQHQLYLFLFQNGTPKRNVNYHFHHLLKSKYSYSIQSLYNINLMVLVLVIHEIMKFSVFCSTVFFRHLSAFFFNLFLNLLFFCFDSFCVYIRYKYAIYMYACVLRKKMRLLNNCITDWYFFI